ncbi:hypothetical protein [uncultured Flavobacterium sp.]|uniref:hypothetical protein n=1 Tax=uncultured Flavobacterium sp. TaxID=165435 RepID=UPI0025EA64BE|nr:hypothetical protein [uncultured Flavobacterium sp.]
MEFNEQIVRGNIKALLNKYLPKLFLFLREKDINEILDVYYNFIQNTKDNTIVKENFLYSLLLLAKSSDVNKHSCIEQEFELINYYLGEFNEILEDRKKKFRALIKGSLKNLDDNKLLENIAEIAVFLNFNEAFTFEEYESKYDNKKEITNNNKDEATYDFKFSKKNREVFYLEVFSIKMNTDKYNKNGFDKCISDKIKHKFEVKTKLLNDKEKRNVFIVPVLQ